MATIDQRELAGGRTRYRDEWPLGGTHADAHTFELHVEATRLHWAEGWIPGCGWVKTTPEPDTEPALLAAYARWHIDSLSGIEERTRTDYHRDLELHLIPSSAPRTSARRANCP
ncbi:hypothetical protein [Nocardiopsis sp. NPDC057823]|uniref:hypothetical protein n=1 Tax=Nocardiopsis sp. NPDC057823 TaxID=3346256 RepID=UPI00366EA76A